MSTLREPASAPEQPPQPTPQAAARARRRRWADIVVLVAAAWAIAAVAWFPPEIGTTAQSGRSAEARWGGWIAAAYWLGGGFGFAGVFVAFRFTVLARVLVAVGGLLLAIAVLVLRHLAPVVLVSLGVTALALLAASPFVGPMPTPEDEGQRR